MTSVNDKKDSEIYLRFSPASPRLLQSFSVQLFHFPHYYVHGCEKKKERRESEFDQKHNFRDVISGRACADRFRCFSIYRGNTCGEMCRFCLLLVVVFFLLLQRFSLFFLLRLFSPPQKTTSLRSTQHYRDNAGYRPLRISCAIIRERHHGCRHLSIHSHLLSDVH